MQNLGIYGQPPFFCKPACAGNKHESSSQRAYGSNKVFKVTSSGFGPNAEMLGQVIIHVAPKEVILENASKQKDQGAVRNENV